MIYEGELKDNDALDVQMYAGQRLDSVSAYSLFSAYLIFSTVLIRASIMNTQQRPCITPDYNQKNIGQAKINCIGVLYPTNSG